MLTFGNTSALYESDMVMVDYETGSYWWQVAGSAIVGALTGETLTLLPSMTITWGEWRKIHPETLVLSQDTGFSRNYNYDPFNTYPDSINRGRFAFPVSEAGRDGRLNPGEKVLVVKVAEDSRAYPLEKLRAAAIQDTLGGQSVVIFSDGTNGGAYDPIANGDELTFEIQNDEFVDKETGSNWNLAGIATSGPLQDLQLPPIPSKTTLWFAIVAADPGITVYQAE